MSSTAVPPLQYWPFAPLDPGGTRAEVHTVNGQASIFLGIDLDGLSRAERQRMLKGAVTVRWLPMPPLMVWLVQTEVMTYDFPFSPGLNGDTWRLDLLAALRSHAPPRIEVVFVHGNLVHRVFKLLTSSNTGADIDLSLSSCAPTMTSDAYNRAVDHYQARYKVVDLMRAVVIVHAR